MASLEEGSLDDCRVQDSSDESHTPLKEKQSFLVLFIVNDSSSPSTSSESSTLLILLLIIVVIVNVMVNAIRKMGTLCPTVPLLVLF